MNSKNEMFGRRLLSDSFTCRCGCGGKALYLCSGEDYGGEVFVDEPACFDAALYLEESAAQLGLPFKKRPCHIL